MQYIKKSRLPIWATLLLIIIAVAVIVAVTLHFAGILDLSIVGVWYQGVFYWGSVEIVNALILTIVVLAGVGGLVYFVTKYVIGQRVIVQNQPAYQPQVGLTSPTLTPVVVDQPKEEAKV
jgi:hypothetical protein